jgi:hypothetical protein
MSGAAFIQLDTFQQALFRLRQGEVVAGRLVDGTQIYITLDDNNVKVEVQPRIGKTRVYTNTFEHLEEMIEGLLKNNVQLFFCPGGEVREVKTFPVKRFADWLADRIRGEANG